MSKLGLVWKLFSNYDALAYYSIHWPTGSITKSTGYLFRAGEYKVGDIISSDRIHKDILHAEDRLVVEIDRARALVYKYSKALEKVQQYKREHGVSK